MRRCRLLGGWPRRPLPRRGRRVRLSHVGLQDAELAEAAQIEDYAVLTGYGSTDVGDVSRAVPTVSVRTATWVPGTSAHSWQAVAASGHSYGAKGTQHAAKAMMLAAVELYTNPRLRETAKAEFIAARGEDYVYESLLGDRAPPLDYRK